MAKNKKKEQNTQDIYVAKSVHEIELHGQDSQKIHSFIVKLSKKENKTQQKMYAQASANDKRRTVSDDRLARNSYSKVAMI